MKILLVNDYSERIGGTEVYLETLAKHLKLQGHEVSYYFGSTDFTTSFARRNTVTGYLKRIFNLKHYLSFNRLVKQIKPDVIHLHNVFNELTPFILLSTHRIPIIMTIHDYHLVQAVFDPEQRNDKPCSKKVCPGCFNCVGLGGMIYERTKRFIHAFLLKRVELFIAPSKYLQNLVAHNSPYSPIQLYNGFELSQPQKLSNKSIALYSGRLTKAKGLQYLIEAVPLVLKKIPQFKLEIAGDGELKKSLIKRVKLLGIEKSVNFLGQLTKEQLMKEYKQSSILVLPANWPENLPSVCIEALSIGRPVVSTNVGGIPEIVKDGVNGILCPPRAPVPLSEAIVKILQNNELLKYFRDNGLENVKIFDIEVHMSKVISIYRKLSSEK